MENIRIEGTAELNNKLKALETAVFVHGMRAAVKSGAKIVEVSAVEKVSVRYGFIKRSITSEVVTNTATTVERDVGAGKKQFYSRYLEVGTKKTAPHPFLRPALDENQERIIAAMVVELKAAVGAVTL